MTYYHMTFDYQLQLMRMESKKCTASCENSENIEEYLAHLHYKDTEYKPGVLYHSSGTTFVEKNHNISL